MLPVIHVVHVFLGLLGFLWLFGVLRLLGVHVFVGFLVQLFTFRNSDYSPPLLGSGGWCGQRGERSLRGIPRHRLPAFRTTPFSSLTEQEKKLKKQKWQITKKHKQ